MSRHGNRERGRRFEMFALAQMSKEFGVSFSAGPTLRRENITIPFDGYAEKNGRIYVLEAKANDRMEIIERTIGRMTLFALRIPDEERARLTFILCVLTDSPVALLKSRIETRNHELPYDLQVRVYNEMKVCCNR